MAGSTRTIHIGHTTMVSKAVTPGVFIPCTPWMRSDAVVGVRFAYEISALFNSPTVTPAYEPATTENDIGTAATTGGTARTTAGVYYDDYDDIKSALSAYPLVRFGFLIFAATAIVAGARVSNARVETRDF